MDEYKFVNETKLAAALTYTANKIRAKLGSSASLDFDLEGETGFGNDVDEIRTGIRPIGALNINENGTYDVTEKASAVVNVPSSGITPTGTKEITITENGTTTEDVTNYANAQITVNVPSGGGNSFYLSQYTTTGDATIANFLNSINYSVHSNTCLIIIRSNGTVAPTIGSYTLNNFIVGFNNGTLVSGSDMYVSGRVAPNTVVPFPRSNESSERFYLDNGLLKNSYTGTSCIAGTGAVVALIEIDLPTDFWNVLSSDTKYIDGIIEYGYPNANERSF